MEGGVQYFNLPCSSAFMAVPTAFHGIVIRGFNGILGHCRGAAVGSHVTLAHDGAMVVPPVTFHGL